MPKKYRELVLWDILKTIKIVISIYYFNRFRFRLLNTFSVSEIEIQEK